MNSLFSGDPLTPEPVFAETKIPVSYPGPYDSLIEAACKSRIEPRYFDEVPCPKKSCPQKGSLRLTAWMVPRHAVVFVEPNVTEYRSLPVPLAVCESCGARIRVLPVEFLPGKTYSLPVIEESCRAYLHATCGLRKSVEKIKGIPPHYSTLHGWLGALGERVLDRALPQDKQNAGGQAARLPTSSIISETAKKIDPGLVSRWTKIQPEIAPSKYQSEFRKERLQACLRLLRSAAALFGPGLYPLTRWEHFLIARFFVPGWPFLSRSALTTIQLDDNKTFSLSCRTSKQTVRIRSP